MSNLVKDAMKIRDNSDTTVHVTCDLRRPEHLRDALGDKRILICSAGVPHERDGASVVLFYHYIDRLRREGYRILHILLIPGEQWPQSVVDDYAEKMADPADPNRVVVTAVRASRFYTETRRHHRLVSSSTEEVATAAGAFSPDIIVSFDILAAWITARVNTPHRLVWLGDLNFQTMLYHAWYAARENPLKSRHLPSNWLGARSWKWVYRDALLRVDQVIVASASSVEQMANIGIKATYEPYGLIHLLLHQGRSLARNAEHFRRHHPLRREQLDQ